MQTTGLTGRRSDCRRGKCPDRGATSRHAQGEDRALIAPLRESRSQTHSKLENKLSMTRKSTRRGGRTDRQGAEKGRAGPTGGGQGTQAMGGQGTEICMEEETRKNRGARHGGKGRDQGTGGQGRGSKGLYDVTEGAEHRQGVVGGGRGIIKAGRSRREGRGHANKGRGV